MPLLFSQARRRLGILYHLPSLCITIHLTTDWGLAQYSSSILLISDWGLAQYSSSIHPTTNWGLAQYSSSIRLITDWGSAQYSSCITSYDFSSFLLFSSLFFFFFFLDCLRAGSLLSLISGARGGALGGPSQPLPSVLLVLPYLPSESDGSSEKTAINMHISLLHYTKCHSGQYCSHK